MKNLRYICVQPRLIYYAWQVEVMINNFIKQGINPNYIDILVAYNPNDATTTPENKESWDKLASHYNSVRFFFYQDTRQQPIHYISSVRPNILKQHWEKYPELANDIIFYHDCDIVFSKPPTSWITNKMLTDDNWYGSDTRFYISHDYILSKGVDVLDKMCEIIGISKELVKENEMNAIGAQYLIKNIDYNFWDKVEKDCEILFKDITALNIIKKQQNPTYHELQIWCSDMWSVLWNGWLRGNKTICHDNFKFTWATEDENTWKKNNIYHNAGVTSPSQGLFYKGEYMTLLPYNVELDVKENTASWYYWNEIKETAKKSCLI